MDTPRIIAAADTIHQVLSRHVLGSKSADEAAEITNAADAALTASDYDSLISWKVTTIKTFVSILYSARKYKEYGDTNLEAAEKVKEIIYSAAAGLKRIAAMQGGKQE
jgi:hypothetical protein